MELEGEVTNAEWRERDRRRTFPIYLLGAVAAGILTVVLYLV